MLYMHGENVQKLFKALFWQHMQCINDQEMDKTTRKRLSSRYHTTNKQCRAISPVLRTGNFDIRFCAENLISAQKC